MLVDRYEPEDIFARVPQAAARIDPVLKELDRVLEDDQLYQQGRADFGKRYRLTLVHGGHSTPVEVRLAHAHLQAPGSVEPTWEPAKQVYDNLRLALVLSCVLGERARCLHPLSLAADGASRNAARPQ